MKNIFKIPRLNQTLFPILEIIPDTEIYINNQNENINCDSNKNKSSENKVYLIILVFIPIFYFLTVIILIVIYCKYKRVYNSKILLR